MSDTPDTQPADEEIRRPLPEQDDPVPERRPPSGETQAGAEAYDTQPDPMEYARTYGDDALADYIDGQPDDIRAELLAKDGIAEVYRRVRPQE